MSSYGKDPEKRAAKRRARKEALARGAQMTTKRQRDISQSQATHASSGRAQKHAAEGARKMERERIA